MTKIIKYPEMLSPRERVLRTFAFEPVDRVPIDYYANPGIHSRLAAALGVDAEGDGVLEALGVDFRGIWPDYTGPVLFPELPDRLVHPFYGYYSRWVEHEGGGYWDYCDFPLLNAEPERIAEFPVASPDWFDYEGIPAMLKRCDRYALYFGSAGLVDVLNATGRVMGTQQTLINIATHDEATLRYINRRLDMELSIMERVLEKAKGRIDFVWMGEDLGTQRAPMISPKLYRQTLRPMHQRFIDLAKAYDLPVMMHCCGSSSFEDFIEMGVSAVDTLQPEAVDMEPVSIAQRFGGRLVFHGAMSTTGALTYGTEQDVVRDAREILAAYMPTRGYCFSPTHMIQNNTPVRNIVAMYNAAHRYGRYI